MLLANLNAVNSKVQTILDIQLCMLVCLLSLFILKDVSAKRDMLQAALFLFLMTWHFFHL